VLEVPITTVNIPELSKMAALISGFWQQVGVISPVVLVDPRTVIKETLRSRNYSTLLYGSLVGADPDLFPFWHSSQVDYPGLNLSQYADRDVDALLVEARGATSTEMRAKDYAKLQRLLIDRAPAIFLYEPTYTYVVGKNVQGVGQKIITTPSDRFADISDWYVATDRVWR
jgi:peptide/nickel transport system substrate-binding protein